MIFGVDADTALRDTISAALLSDCWVRWIADLASDSATLACTEQSILNLIVLNLHAKRVCSLFA
jgi:hypothetical protein